MTHAMQDGAERPRSDTGSQLEFTARMACIMSLAALSTDIMIPGLLDMGRDLAISDDRNVQLIVSIVFLGLAPGQLVFGPLADGIGRKPAMLIGTGFFLLGSLITVIAPSYFWLLAGRVVQGFGLGAPRTITLAIIRDQYAGAPMARIMSNIMSVFACVPMIAPMLGQMLLQAAGWRSIFGFVLAYGLIVWLWFLLRQPETLAASRRTAISITTFTRAAGEVCGNRIVLLYALASGLIFAGFVVYMSTAAQIFLQIYDVGSAFGYIFALTGLPMVIAAHLNGRWVERLGMRRICYLALILVIGTSALFSLWTALDPRPGVAWIVLYMMVIMFAEGTLYSNLNALAMEPLDRHAGLGATFVSSLSMLVSVPLGIVAARLLSDSIMPLIVIFLTLGVLTLLVMRIARQTLPSPAG